MELLKKKFKPKIFNVINVIYYIIYFEFVTYYKSLFSGNNLNKV